MKKSNKSPQGKKQHGVTELTDLDLQQVQGGMMSQAQVEKSKKGSTVTTPTQPK